MKSRVARLFAFAVLTGTCLPLAAASAAAPRLKPAQWEFPRVHCR